ncbi:hypothetical protein [Nonomuraea angiospora]|nr:hypothetical protein [Nonomuraea angiospora]MDX3099998.1 hypothetical protein [Nonomuraea angiospora]
MTSTKPGGDSFSSYRWTSTDPSLSFATLVAEKLTRLVVAWLGPRPW